MLDIRIINGMVIDGSGSKPVRADVGITGENISDIGDLSRAEASLTIDATAEYVCPGFIDVHSHSDTYLIVEPSAPSKVFQGVTTEVTGNCGASSAPVTGSYHMPSDWEAMKYPAKWSTVAQFRKLLAEVKPAVNVFTLVGHNAIRAGVIGYDDRTPSAEELEKMKRLLDQSLSEGGKGLSSGLIYPPGMFSGRDELVELNKVVKRHDGIYTSHMRSEGASLLKSIEETISMGREAGVRVEISHLKTSGRSNWHLIDQALALIRNAVAEGIKVAADRYPYTAAGTDLDVILPDWAEEGGRDALVKRLNDPVQVAVIRKWLMDNKAESYWSIITIGSTSHPDNQQFRGRALVEVAGQLKLHPVDAALRIMTTDEARTSAFFSGMNEENMYRILAEPYVMIGSDASVRSLTGPLSEDYPHPRAFGTFPRFLRMSLDGKTVPLEEAIRKMTSLPASHFGMSRRGRLEKGYKADIAVFNPSEIRDLSTFKEPHQYSKGIKHLIVNGTVTIQSGKLTGNRAGMVL